MPAEAHIAGAILIAARLALAPYAQNLYTQKPRQTHVQHGHSSACRGCYAVFGVDSEQAGRYFTDVVKLEGALEQSEYLTLFECTFSKLQRCSNA